MKIILQHRSERGYAVVIMLGLITLLLLVMLANTQNVTHMGRELNRLEDKQKAHWKNLKAGTNVVEEVRKGWLPVNLITVEQSGTVSVGQLNTFSLTPCPLPLGEGGSDASWLLTPFRCKPSGSK